MKNLNNRFHAAYGRQSLPLLAMVFFTIFSQPALAQIKKGDLRADASWGEVTYSEQVAGGEDPQAVDYTLPADTEDKYLYLIAEGADGGDAKDKGPDGGEGATVQGLIPVANTGNAIPPGSTVRFIIGHRGQSRDRHGGGGGGTAVAFKAPGSDTWNLLMVAGGGGGAGRKDSGNPASESCKASGEGGADGGGDSGGGGGANGDGDGVAGHYVGKAGFTVVGNVKIPTGGRGGYSNKSTICNGGFGFGGGGLGVYSVGGIAGAFYSGGGGGGYSGGKGGHMDNGGGGGGSYVNEPYFTKFEKTNNGTTEDPTNGYVKYLIFDEPNITVTKLGFSRDDSEKITLTTQGSSTHGLKCLVVSKQVPPALPSLHSASEAIDIEGKGDCELIFFDQQAPKNWFYEGFQLHFNANMALAVNGKPKIIQSVSPGQAEIQVQAFGSGGLVYTLYRQMGFGISMNQERIASNDTGRFDVPAGHIYYMVEIGFADNSIGYTKQVPINLLGLAMP